MRKKALNDNDTSQSGVKLIFKKNDTKASCESGANDIFFFSIRRRHRLRVDNEMSNFSGGNLCVSIGWLDMRY